MKRKKYNKICKECGKVFSANRPQQIFCSDYCRYHKKKYEPKKCPECKEDFIPNRTDRIYCSKRCLIWHSSDVNKKRNKEYRLKHPLVLPIKKCLFCNKKFTRKNSLHKFCSAQCSSDNWKSEHLNYVNKNRNSWLKLRFDILRRDKFTCRYCGRTPKNGTVLNIDHIKPKIKGGKYSKENLITSCFECNQGKKDVLLTQREMKKLTT